MCGLAIIRDAQMHSATFTRVFCRIMPSVWAPEASSPSFEASQKTTGFCSFIVAMFEICCCDLEDLLFVTIRSRVCRLKIAQLIER